MVQLLLLLLLGLPACYSEGCCWKEDRQIEGSYGWHDYECPTHHDIQNVVIFASFRLRDPDNEQPKLTCTVCNACRASVGISCGD